MYAFLADMTNPNPVIGLGLLPGVNVTLVYTPLMSYEDPAFLNVMNVAT